MRLSIAGIRTNPQECNGFRATRLWRDGSARERIDKESLAFSQSLTKRDGAFECGPPVGVPVSEPINLCEARVGHAESRIEFDGAPVERLRLKFSACVERVFGSRKGLEGLQRFGGRFAERSVE